jgi:LysM repeat protein
MLLLQTKIDRTNLQTDPSPPQTFLHKTTSFCVFIFHVVIFYYHLIYNPTIMRLCFHFSCCYILLLILIVNVGHIFGQKRQICTDACLSSERDGSCDDGMQNSASQWCKPGSDCSDCGPRKLTELPAKTYIVQRGDTLNRIGELHGVTADVIAIRNSIPDPSGLEVGQVLLVTKAAYEDSLKNVDVTEVKRRKRLMSSARVLAYERLFGKTKYEKYMDAVYNNEDDDDDNNKKKICHTEIDLTVATSLDPMERPFPSFDDTEQKFKLNDKWKGDEYGGWWEPLDCEPRDTVGIIIPYRNREEHLQAYIARMHPLLRKQKVRYKIFIIDQVDEKRFNRAKLLNVGAVLASKDIDIQKITKGNNKRFCFIFHDVDLLPQSEQTLYSCPDKDESPRHLSVYVDTHKRCIYKEIFGGVSVMHVEHFASVNGYANVYWGWGGEDDDMSARIRCGIGKKIARPLPCSGPCKFNRDCIHEMEVITDYTDMNEDTSDEFDEGGPGKYVMLDGHSGTGKKMDTRNLVYLVNACRRFTGDGLNTLQFTVEEKCKYQVGAYYQCKVNL